MHLWCAENSVVRVCRMRNIFAGKTRHMTMNAGIRRFLSFLNRQRAATLLMADHTSHAIEFRVLRFGRSRMWIMAGDAPHRPFTHLITDARSHLFNLAVYEPARLAVDSLSPGSRNKNSPDIFQPVARAKIVMRPTITENACFAAKMALVADAVATGRIEPGRIDNRVLNP